jgi:hypothetical protein
MSVFPNVTPVFLNTIISRLVPWFLIAAGGSLEAAHDAVISMLASYNVETEEEIRLAAEIASFGFSALAALSTSWDADLSLNAILRLRGSANALHRSAHQCQRTLDRLRKERQVTAAGATAQPADQTATTTAATTTATGVPRPNQSASAPPKAQVPLSRQQRRVLERATEKVRQTQAAQIRRDAKRAVRVGAPPVIGVSPPPQEPYDQSLAA